MLKCNSVNPRYSGLIVGGNSSGLMKQNVTLKYKTHNKESGKFNNIGSDDENK
jgi:hypothetical protein